MISSVSNPAVKNVCALMKKASLRREEGLFVVEGRRMAEEIPADRLEQAYVTEDFLKSEEGRRLGEQLRAEIVSPEVMEKMSDTKTPQGILALVRMEKRRREELYGRFLLVLESVQDPGNVGTLLRTAEAAGAGGIILDRGSADPYSPKVLRSTMGAIFRLPFVISENLPDELQKLRRDGYHLLAAHLKGAVSYDTASYPERCAILLGNEGNGLSDTVTALSNERVFIPMEGKTESLNVAVAGALLLYEARRKHASAVSR